MQKTVVLPMLVASLVLCLSAQPCEDYACDSAVVAEISEVNDLDQSIIPVLSGGRVGALHYVGLITAKKMTVLPECVGRLSELQILDLAHNEIAEIPVSLMLCTNLRSLRLNNNQLSGIPDELTSLSISQPEIHNISYEKYDTTYSLDLSHNRLCSLSSGVILWLNMLSGKNWQATQDCSTAVICRIPLSGALRNDKSSFCLSVSSGIAVIRFEVPENGHVKINVLCPDGRLAATVADEYKSAGSYSLQWRVPARISAGVYFVTQACKGAPVQMSKIFFQ
jgi:Leucine-rich repeat (LRR) protein